MVVICWSSAIFGFISGIENNYTPTRVEKRYLRIKYVNK